MTGPGSDRARSIAFVPSAPLLVPALAGGSADLDADLRSDSLAVVRAALDTDPQRVLVVAPTATALVLDGDFTWGFSGFGVSRRNAAARSRLPWALGIGDWLLDECGWEGSRSWVGVVPERDGVIAGDLVDRDTSIAVIAVGDGSACRTEKAPGHLDARAEDFDIGIADALARGDATALAAVDGALATELSCAGLPVWRWLAERIRADDATVTSARLVSHTAPYGVGYFVASWSIS